MLLRTVPYLAGEHIVCSIIPKEAIGDELEKKGLRVIYLNCAKWYDLRVFSRLYRTLIHEKPDLLVTYLLHADIMGRMVGTYAHIPCIVSSIRCAHQDKRFWVFLSRLTTGFADHFVSVSTSVKEWMVQTLGAPKEKITVIHNGISFPSLEKKLSNRLRDHLNIPLDHLLMTYVGRLDPQKGLSYFIDAVELLRHRLTIPFTVLIVGDGGLYDQLTHQTQRLHLASCIRFLGMRQDVPEILMASDIFVSPTLFEGISNAIIEAMSYALPIVTTDIPENRELIISRKNGILVPIKNSQLLAKEIEALASDPKRREALGAAARQTIHDAFRIEETIQQLNQLFNDLYVRYCR